MDIIEFLSTSYTAYQATENTVKMLEEGGFKRIYRGEKSGIIKGGKYFLTINDSAFIAVSVGEEEGGLNIACAHTDSPCLKVKGNKLSDSPEGSRLNVEVYGGLNLRSFLDIPLKIAGRAFVKTEDGLESRLVVSDFNVVVPSLCVHHDKGEPLSAQFDMLPLFGGEDVYSSLGLANVLDADLYAVPDLAPFFVGVEQDILCSPRIDDLLSVYSCVKAILSAKPKGISVVACFDNEEIGSGTKQGAGSAILEETLNAVYSALDIKEKLPLDISNGLLLSVDNAHAAHPSKVGTSDPVNLPLLNNGVVIKHHSNYSTDAKSSAILQAILSEKGIPYQHYYNNSDLRCGSTLGLIASRNLCMDAVDIGIAQLAMHSSVETVGAKDVERLTDCIAAVFERRISHLDGVIKIE